MLDEEMTSRAKEFVCRLSDPENPAAERTTTTLLVCHQWTSPSAFGSKEPFAEKLLAQIALGDEILFEASESDEADVVLLAAVLFGLAAQQGQEISRSWMP
jgi:hypothetical protein